MENPTQLCHRRLQQCNPTNHMPVMPNLETRDTCFDVPRVHGVRQIPRTGSHLRPRTIYI